MGNAVCKSVLFGEVQLHHWPSSILFAPARPGLLFSHVAFKAYSIEKKLCSNWFKSMKKSMKCMKCLWSAWQESKDFCNNVLKPLLQTVGASDSPWRRREVPAFGVRTDCCLELWHPRMNLLMPFGRSWYVLICFIGFLLCHKALNDRYHCKRWVGPNEHTIIRARFVLAAHGLSRIPVIGMEPDAELSFVQDYSGMCMHAHMHTHSMWVYLCIYKRYYIFVGQVWGVLHHASKWLIKLVSWHWIDWGQVLQVSTTRDVR